MTSATSRPHAPSGRTGRGAAAPVTRERRSLDGTWTLHYEPGAPGRVPPETGPPDDGPWVDAAVPGPWQSAAPALRESFGTVWYRRPFLLPEHWRGGAILLHFGAVNYFAQVWLNGHYLGDHEGGYLPFEFAVEALVRPGQTNELVVRAVLPSTDPARYPDFPFTEIPHGKQSWYGPLGGIWQPVWIERRPAHHIEAVHLTPRDATLEVRALLRPATGAARLRAEVLDAGGDVVARARSSDAHFEIPVPAPRAWHPDDPHLYTLRLALEAGDEVDVVEEPFGFRTIEARAGRLYLNGAPLYLRGVLDQDYYPDGLCTPPSLEYIEAQFRQVKAMGFNCVRVHIKIADPRYYEAADRVGLLVWTELPNWEFLTAAARTRAQETLAGMIRRDGNHPSIVIWTIINEDWGTELTTTVAHRRWLAGMVEEVKRLDPTRLVVDNSACWPNHHVYSDLDDYHIYHAIPDSQARWEHWVGQFASRPDWLYAPGYGDQRERRAPLLLSEFGNWGLPDLAPLETHYGGEPWWFETGWERSAGETYPHGVKRRFAALALDRVFGEFAGLARATQRAQFEALKQQIESLRLYPDIRGYVVTELTDLYWEANGLLDMLRRPKVYFDQLAALNADTMLFLRMPRHAYWTDEVPHLEWYLSHEGGEALAELSIGWELRLPGQQIVGELPGQWRTGPGELCALPPLDLFMPALDTPARATLRLRARNGSGQTVATGEQSLLLLPRSRPSRTLAAVEPDLVQVLEACGYEVVSRADPTIPFVTTWYDSATQHLLDRGGRALLLAEKADAIRGPLPRFGLELRDRADGEWSGDWVGTFAWYRRDRFARDLPGDGRFDLTFAGVMPQTVIANARPLDFQSHVLAGLFVGWIQRPVALVQDIPIGEGRLLVTTLRLKDHLLTDPVAATLFEAHLRYLLDEEEPPQAR